MEKFEQKMKAEGLSQAAIDAFRLNYEQLVAGVTGLVRKGVGISNCIGSIVLDAACLHQGVLPGGGY